MKRILVSLWIIGVLECSVAHHDQANESAASPASTEEKARPAVEVTIGPRESMLERDEMPFVMDSSLPTLRRDDKSWFFYHSVDWGKSNDKYCGTASNPLKTKCGTRAGMRCTT